MSRSAGNQALAVLQGRITELETELVAERQRSAAANSALCFMLSFSSAALAGREYYTPAAARRCIHDVSPKLRRLSGVVLGQRARQAFPSAALLVVPSASAMMEALSPAAHIRLAVSTVSGDHLKVSPAAASLRAEPSPVHFVQICQAPWQ